MEPTALEGLVTSITGQATAIAGVIPDLVVAALGVAVLIFAARLGWRLVKSLARG